MQSQSWDVKYRYLRFWQRYKELSATWKWWGKWYPDQEVMSRGLGVLCCTSVFLWMDDCMCMDILHVEVQIATGMGGLAWFSAQRLIVPHFFFSCYNRRKVWFVALTALGYNLVKYSLCKYHVGAVMWYTLYKKIDFIGVSVYNSDNKEHTSVYPKSPSLVCWFDFNHLFETSAAPSLPFKIVVLWMKNGQLNVSTLFLNFRCEMTPKGSISILNV